MKDIFNSIKLIPQALYDNDDGDLLSGRDSSIFTYNKGIPSCVVKFNIWRRNARTFGNIFNQRKLKMIRRFHKYYIE